MKLIAFDWDKKKSLSNQKKHGISFEEAQTIFVNENALLIHDPDHSDEEDRFILLGMSAKFRILVVCHCYRKAMKSLESYLLERQHAMSKRNIGRGDEYEKRIRFF